METPIDISRSHYTEDDVQQMRTAMRLSLVVGFLMLFIKGYAYFLTGSTAILSDAAESVVHILAVSFAVYSLGLSLKPADERHMYGHDRISFFSAGFEGAMIIIAAVYITFEAIRKLILGVTIERIDTGTYIIAIAALINGMLGWFIYRRGKKFHSLVLVANGKHVLTDSWTSLGVIIALILILFTGWLPFDPIIAIVVAANIVWTGAKLMRQSIGGLMDESDVKVDAIIRDILSRETQKYKIEFHGLRHRNAGNKLLIEFHLLFPVNITLAEAHEQASLIEQELHKTFPTQTDILSHLEPMEGHDEFHEKMQVKKSVSPSDEHRA
jgi:cation diffusion facilitator family transporter